MYKETLLDLVNTEATRIRKYATPEEIDNLDFTYFNPESRSNCIYGQLTGSCYNRRAYTLIRKCASQVYLNEGMGLSRSNIEDLNGKPEAIKDPRDRLTHYHSPIELYVLINHYEGQLENPQILIDYIKGKSDTLNLIDFHSRYFLIPQYV